MRDLFDNTSPNAGADESLISDEQIERLLDRDLVQRLTAKSDAESTEENKSGPNLMGRVFQAFDVENVWRIDLNEQAAAVDDAEVAASGAPAAADTPGPKKDEDKFWEELIRERSEAAKTEEDALLGKGKRRRDIVDYSQHFDTKKPRKGSPKEGAGKTGGSVASPSGATAGAPMSIDAMEDSSSDDDPSEYAPSGNESDGDVSVGDGTDVGADAMAAAVAMGESLGIEGLPTSAAAERKKSKHKKAKTSEPTTCQYCGTTQSICWFKSMQNSGDVCASCSIQRDRTRIFCYFVWFADGK